MSGGLKIGIVQNEFAPVSAKGEEIDIEGTGYQTMHVNNGSVFCICRLEHFTENLAGFVSRHGPEMILLESSGLSDPSSVGEIVNDARLRDIISLRSIICIADATSFSKSHKLVRYTRQQAIIADQIIVNKTDRIDSAERDKLKDEIRALNPYASVYFTTYCNVNTGKVLSGSIRPGLTPGSSYRPDVSSMVLRTAEQLSRDGMMEFLNEFSAKAYRIKGVVSTKEGLFSVQCTMNDVNTKLLKNIGITELIAISDRFSLKELRIAYKNLAKC